MSFLWIRVLVVSLPVSVLIAHPCPPTLFPFSFLWLGSPLSAHLTPKPLNSPHCVGILLLGFLKLDMVSPIAKDILIQFVATDQAQVFLPPKPSVPQKLLPLE